MIKRLAINDRMNGGRLLWHARRFCSFSIQIMHANIYTYLSLTIPIFRRLWIPEPFWMAVWWVCMHVEADVNISTAGTKENHQMRPFSDILKISITNRVCSIRQNGRALMIIIIITSWESARFMFPDDRRHRYKSANNIIIYSVVGKYGFCAETRRLVCLPAMSFDIHFHHHHFTIDSPYEFLWVSVNMQHSHTGEYVNVFSLLVHNV